MTDLGFGFGVASPSTAPPSQSVDIFSKEFLLVPIHEGLHWSLAIVCFPSHQRDANPKQIPCILHFDSLSCTINSRQPTTCLLMLSE